MIWRHRFAELASKEKKPLYSYFLKLSGFSAHILISRTNALSSISKSGVKINIYLVT